MRVFMASGEELDAELAEDISTVKSLKQHLQMVYGYPRFRQRLLHSSVMLADSSSLDSRMPSSTLIQVVFFFHVFFQGLSSLIKPCKEKGSPV